jgi:hypothetical protein
MSLATASANLKIAASAAIDTVKSDASKADTIKATLLATIDSEIGAEAVGVASLFTHEEAKASAWESRHLKLLNLIALAGWLFFAGALFLRLHG